MNLFAQWNVKCDIDRASIGGDMALRLDGGVRVVWVESPGSKAMEMKAEPAIAAACQTGSIPVAMDCGSP